MEAEITINYVNPRKDNRPASIKGSDGNYYNVPDEHFAFFQNMQNQSGTAHYEIHDGRWRWLTGWNGQAFGSSGAVTPNQRNGSSQSNLSPVPTGHSAQTPLPPIYSNGLAAAITAGKVDPLKADDVAIFFSNMQAGLKILGYG